MSVDTSLPVHLFLHTFLFLILQYQRMYGLHERVGLVCQTPCCSSPSGSLFHIWPLVQASRPLCPSHLCHPANPREGPGQVYGLFMVCLSLWQFMEQV